MITQQKTRISASLPTNLVIEVRQASSIQNVSQSFILQNALEDWFDSNLAKDAKALSKMSFKDLPSEDEWCSVQSKI